MTEAEAYAFNKWPLSGSGFVLPATGDDRDYMPYFDAGCNSRGIVATEAKERAFPDGVCRECNQKVIFLGGSDGIRVSENLANPASPVPEG